MAEAKAKPPPDSVPYAFEARVMHCVGTQPKPDVALAWVAGLWHAVVPCAALALTSVAVTMAVYSKTDLDDSSGDTAYTSSEGIESVDAAPFLMSDPEGLSEHLW
jgi:hypothetical protein